MAFFGVSMCFGQTSTQRLQVVQENSPFSTAIGILSTAFRGSKKSRASLAKTVGPAYPPTAGQAETQEKHSMQSRSGLIDSKASRVSLPEHPCRLPSRVITGAISQTKSLITERFSGSRISPSAACRSQASAGSPFIRIAHEPH